MGFKRLRRPPAPPGPPPVKSLPVVAAPNGDIMISAGKYARNAVMSVFDQLGGAPAMALWAQEEPGEFYTKLFAKTITREVEERRVDTVEDLLDAIDVESTPVEATDAEFEDIGRDQAEAGD